MQPSKIVICVILVLISLGSFMISGFQFKQKGFLFNNAYLYASKKEREIMNKKPYYRQSAIVFLLIGTIFLINAIELIIECFWLFWVSMLFCAIVIVYAIVSSIKMK